MKASSHSLNNLTPNFIVDKNNFYFSTDVKLDAVLKVFDKRVLNKVFSAYFNQ